MPALNLLTRAEWGARPPARPLLAHTPVRIVLHHSAVPTAREYRGAISVRQIQDFHMDTRNFDDIGYHFVLGPEGALYEGRPISTVGAHAEGKNAGSIGICVIGDYRKDRDPLTLSAIATLADLIRWLISAYRLHPKEIYGHKDFKRTTECPGDQLYDLIPFFRDRFYDLLFR